MTHVIVLRERSCSTSSRSPEFRTTINGVHPRSQRPLRKNSLGSYDRSRGVQDSALRCCETTCHEKSEERECIHMKGNVGVTRVV